MISAALLGTVATKRTVAPPSSLTLQISLDYGASWQNSPVTDYSPYFSFSTKSYDLRALGTGTEGISVVSSNFNFAANLSNSTIVGGDPLNVQLYVNYNGVGGESATITVTLTGGATLLLYVSS